MKVASIAKNILTQYDVSPENMRSAAMQAYAQRGKLSAELNCLQTEIEDSKSVLKVLKRYHKVKGIHAELKNLSGKQNFELIDEGVINEDSFDTFTKSIAEFIRHSPEFIKGEVNKFVFDLYSANQTK